MVYEKNAEWFVDITESDKVVHTHGPYATREAAETILKRWQASKQEKPL